MKSMIVVIQSGRGGVDVAECKWQARLGWLLGSLRGLGER